MSQSALDKNILSMVESTSTAMFLMCSASSYQTLQPQRRLSREQPMTPRSMCSSTTVLSSSSFCLALRRSSQGGLKSKWLGFTFGRNLSRADIACGQGSNTHISNQHFCIYDGQDGHLMLRDLSTNGTTVDGQRLRGKSQANDTCRIVSNTSIRIESNNPEHLIEFVVVVPQNAAHLDRASNGIGRDNPRDSDGELSATLTVVQSYSGAQASWDGGSRYRQIGFIGRGSFASVYKMSARQGDRVFAMKEINKKGELDSKVVNEMKIMRKLQHPNIVEFVDYHEDVERLYIVMEFVAGGSFQDYLDLGQVMCDPLAKEMCRQVLAALKYLHNSNITHRDIKPDNLLIAETDPMTVKVSDFGLSKDGIGGKAYLRTFCGTLLYCAPEVYPDFTGRRIVKRQRGDRGRTQYTSSVDIWSFGAVMWYALCGEPPFAGKVDKTGFAMYTNIKTTLLCTAPLEKAKVPASCIDLLMEMLKKEPRDRPTACECLTKPWLKSDAVEQAGSTAGGTTLEMKQHGNLSFRGKHTVWSAESNENSDDNDRVSLRRESKRRRAATDC